MAENWGLIGHEWAVELLKGQLAHERLRHAYLLTGPGGIGRRTLALALASAANCQQPPAPGEFCGQCRACRGLAAMGHPDLLIVQREEDDREIKVDAVRELGRMLALTPYESKYQIALLLDFEEASKHAANALLKTLEEPAGRVLMLLTSTSAQALPETIASRCEMLRLRPVPADRLAAGLQQQHGIPAEQAALLARVSGGRPGYALRLHEQPEALEERGEWLADGLRLLEEDRVGRMAYAEELSKDRERLTGALLVWLSFWRDVLLRAAQPEAEIANIDQEVEIDDLASELGRENARRVVAEIEGTLGLLETNVNVRLAAETLLLKWPKRTIVQRAF